MCKCSCAYERAIVAEAKCEEMESSFNKVSKYFKPFVENFENFERLIKLNNKSNENNISVYDESSTQQDQITQTSILQRRECKFHIFLNFYTMNLLY